jgi:hypothetical protein
MCQGCVDDGCLSQETYDKIEAFLEKYPQASWGPAHVVLEDDNTDDYNIKWSLGLAKAALSHDSNDLFHPEEDIITMNKMEWYEDEDPKELQATVAFLEELLEIPENVR